MPNHRHSALHALLESFSEAAAKEVALYALLDYTSLMRHSPHVFSALVVPSRMSAGRSIVFRA